MTREIHLVKPPFISTHLLFNGPIKDKNRREYKTLDELLKAVKELKIDSDRKIEVYIEGYPPEDAKAIKSVLGGMFSRANYFIPN
ncbi:MAG: hypothetical protein QW727_01480 [Candidatus Pacearchaeota archaeon]